MQEILFVCQSNGGKSQMAEAIAKKEAGETISIHSAGTNPGNFLNEEAITALAEIGADMSRGQPSPIDPELLQRADRVIILGTDARVELPAGARGILERWKIDEPSLRGIKGMERMRILRDDIANRVRDLLKELK